MFQGHEAAAPGYLSRINLDADAAPGHGDGDARTQGDPLPDFDGSTWDPFAQRLLFTAENSARGGVSGHRRDYPSRVRASRGVFGRGGYEGIQADSDGNIWLVEDVGGRVGTAKAEAKQPNRFVYGSSRATPATCRRAASCRRCR